MMTNIVDTQHAQRMFKGSHNYPALHAHLLTGLVTSSTITIQTMFSMNSSR